MDRQMERDSLFDIEIMLFGCSLDELRRRLSYDDRLLAFWEIVEKQYDNADLDLSQVARQAGMSKNRLNNLLHLIVGTTAAKLLTHYRLYASVGAALKKNRTFTDIAFDCGFSYPSSYTRAFTRVFGVPPTELLTRQANYKRNIRPDSIKTNGRTLVTARS